jgi:hypothetical protein
MRHRRRRRTRDIARRECVKSSRRNDTVTLIRDTQHHERLRLAPANRHHQDE